jgi:hypothetical protein
VYTSRKGLAPLKLADTLDGGTVHRRHIMWYEDSDSLLVDAMIAFGVGVLFYSTMNWLGIF